MSAESIGAESVGFESMDTQPQVTMTVRQARVVLGNELRCIDAVLETIRAPRRTERARRDMNINLFDREAVDDEVEGMISILKQPSMDLEHKALYQAPFLRAGDLATLGISYLVRRALYIPVRTAATQATRKNNELYADGGARVQELREQAMDRIAKRQIEVDRHIELSETREIIHQGYQVTGVSCDQDLVTTFDTHGRGLAISLSEQCNGLAARARLRQWIEALQRSGVSPRMPSIDPGGQPGEPLTRLLRTEMSGLQGVQTQALDLLKSPLKLVKSGSRPNYLVECDMNAIETLRSMGMKSEDIVAGAAICIVSGIPASDLATRYQEYLIRNIEKTAPRNLVSHN